MCTYTQYILQKKSGCLKKKEYLCTEKGEQALAKGGVEDSNHFNCNKVMKRLLFMVLSAGLMLMAACTQKSENAYTITGTADGTQDGDTVFICEMQGFFNLIPTDTTIIKDGKFTFIGDFEGAAVRWLMPVHEGEPTTMAMFVLEKGDIKATLIKGEGESKIEGGPNGKLYDEFMAGSNEIGQQMDAPWRISTDSTKTDAERQAAEAKLDSLNKVMVAYQKKFILDHVPSAVSDMLFGYCSFSFSEEEQEEILKVFGEKQPNFPVYKRIMAERKAAESTEIGQTYIDMKMAAPNGKDIQLSDYVGKSKYVLIDFWASWCGPCRQAMPQLQSTVKKFKKLKVYGIAVSENKIEDAQRAIADLKITWPVMNDPEAISAKAYGVNAIPAMILFAPDGKIAARDFTVSSLESMLEEKMVK